MEKLSQLGVDVFLADTSLAVRKVAVFTESELAQVSAKARELGKQFYVQINKMIHEEDIDRLESLLKFLKRISIDGIVIADLTVYAKAIDVGLEHLIIYQPGTFNTNSFDLEFFNDKKIKGITISKEITLEEIETIAKNRHDIELSLIGHGYIDMFYSRRKLLRNYAIHKHIENEKLTNNYHLSLEEEIRENERYPILEDFAGTHVFRSKKLQSYQEVERLKDIIDDFIINRIFIGDEEYSEAISAYVDIKLRDEFLLKYQKGYDSGFYDRYTEKIKGENNES